MANSRVFKPINLWYALISFLTWSSCVHAAISFDKLTACGDITRIYGSLKANPTSGRTNCRSPRDSLEREVMNRSGLDASQLCFLESSPAPFVDGFSCARPLVPGGGAELVCFRSAATEDLRNYREQFKEKFAEAKNKYLATATTCGASNGDSVDAWPSLLPFTLTHVAQFEFGYAMGLGNDRVPDSTILHGYAITDPSITPQPPAAIEFVYLLVGAPKYSPWGTRTTIGNWMVRVDDSKQFDNQYNQAARKQGAPVTITSTSYDFENNTAQDIAPTAKVRVLERLQAAIVKNLEEEGFEAKSGAALKRFTGMSGQDFVRGASKGAPFAFRGAAAKRLSPDITILLNQSRPRCTQDGAIAVYLFSLQPVPDRKIDYGSLFVAVAGIGACSRSSSVTRTYMNGLAEDLNELILNTLKRKEYSF